MILRDAVDISRSPKAIFGFFSDMEQHYLHWHPDHKLFRWVEGRSLAVGNAFYFEELIGGKLLKKRVIFTRIEAPWHIEFAPTFWLMRIFLPRMLFRIEATAPTGCRVVAEIHIRMGPIAARLNRRELDAIREHMRVEGINLKRLSRRPTHVSRICVRQPTVRSLIQSAKSFGNPTRTRLLARMTATMMAVPASSEGV